MLCLKNIRIIYIFQIIANSLIFLKAVFRLFQQALIRFDRYFGQLLIANSRIMVPGQYACTGQQRLQTQNLNSIVRTRGKS